MEVASECQRCSPHPYSLKGSMTHFGDYGTDSIQVRAGLDPINYRSSKEKKIIVALLQLGEKFDESTPDGREASKL